MRVCDTIKVFHLPSEMFNDALYFKEVAESLPKDISHDFERRRYLRASIIFSFIVIESHINEFIIKSLKAKKSSLSTEEDKKFFKDTLELLKNHLIGMNIKNKLSSSVKLVTGNKITSSPEYEDFKWLNEIRNRLIHFRGERAVYTKDITIENANKAIETVRKIIKTIHELDGTPYPQFVDRKQSESHVISSITLI